MYYMFTSTHFTFMKNTKKAMKSIEKIMYLCFIHATAWSCKTKISHSKKLKFMESHPQP